MSTTSGCVVLVLLGLLAAVNVTAQTTRGCNLPPKFPCPTARIVDFSADKTVIKRGESVIMSWAAENPGAMEITPDVGPVITRDSMKVTPAVTTTYTLKVSGGPDGQTLTRTLTVTVAGTTARVVAAEVASDTAARPIPRTEDGKPLLQGIYSPFGAARGPVPPLGPGDLPRAPTLKPGMESYKMPPPNPNEVVSDCTIGSVPPSIGPYSIQIIQNKDFVVLFYEYMNLHRIIPLDGQPHEPGSSWMGDSIGRWDGDTLVVDTNGFNTRSTVGPGGDRHRPYKHSDALHMVERFKRVDYTTLVWETTLEDPRVFTEPWRTVIRMAYHPELKTVEEYRCEENVKNYDYLVDPKAKIKIDPN